MSSILTLFLVLAACGKDAIPTSPQGPEQNQLVSVVRVQPSAAVIEPDAQVNLAAVVSSARGRTVNGRPVQWSSSDERVAYVDSRGRIVAGEEGTATITANVLGVSGEATIDVRGTVTGIAIDEPLYSLVEGGKERLTATLTYSNGATRPARGLRWWSERPDRLWIDGDGDAFGRESGDVDIRISGRGKQDTKRVKVRGSGVSGVTVTATKSTLVVGETAEVWATVLNGGGNRVSRQVTWTSSAPSVVAVSSLGSLSAASVGTAVITGTADGVSGSVSISVQAGSAGGGGGGSGATQPGPVTDLAVATREERRLQIRFTEVDDGTGSPASYQLRYGLQSGFQWGSSLIVEKGTCSSPLTGTGAGTVRSCWAEGLVAGEDYTFQIVAYRPEDETFGGLSNAVSARTLDPAILVDVTPTAFAIETGDSRTVDARIVDSYGNEVEGTPTWTTTRSSVASISSSGHSATVSGVAPGQATIRATALGVSGGSDATVTDPIVDTSGETSSTGGTTGTSGGGTGAPPPPPAGQHFVGDFSAASSDAELQSWLNITTPSNVHAEPGVGMRYDFVARPNHCGDHTLASQVSLPSGTKEVWMRFRIRFSSSWTTVNPNCSSPAPGYKTVLTWLDARADVGAGRFDFKHRPDRIDGTPPGWSTAPAVPVGVAFGSGARADQMLWDNRWHTVEIHQAIIGDDQALVQIRIDGQVTHNYQTKTTTGLSPRWMHHINIGANRNLGAITAMNIWWDDFEVWVGSTDPGFGFSSPAKY